MENKTDPHTMKRLRETGITSYEDYLKEWGVKKMNQIPTGEYCDGCPCLCEHDENRECHFYMQELQPSVKAYPKDKWERLPQCLTDMPQVITKDGRRALYDHITDY